MKIARRISGALLIAFVLCSLAIAQMTYNIGWNELQGTNIFDLYPPCSTPLDYCSPVYNVSNGDLNGVYSYSGGTADTLNSKYFIWGGGHNDYCGNEIYMLDLAAVPNPKMVRANNPTQPEGCKTQGTVFTPFGVKDLQHPEIIEAVPTAGPPGSPTGYPVGWNGDDDSALRQCNVDAQGNGCRPQSRHTVDKLTYLQGSDAILAWSGSLTSQGGTASTGLWVLNNLSNFETQALSSPAAGDMVTWWTRKDLNVGLPLDQNDNQFGFALYDYPHNLTWILGSVLYRYNHVANSITQVSENRPRDPECTAVYDPDNNRIWCVGGGQNRDGSIAQNGVAYFDLNNPTTADWVYVNHANCLEDGLPHAECHQVPLGCDISLNSVMNPGVAFDPVWRVLVIWQQPITFTMGWATPTPVPEKLYLFNPSPTQTRTINALGVTTLAPYTSTTQNSCAQAALPGDPLGPQPVITSAADPGVFGRLQYFPNLGGPGFGIFAVCHGHVNCKVLRLR